MGHDEALQTIVSMAAQGLIAFTNHALFEKMPALGLIEDDVRHCLTHPTGIEKATRTIISPTGWFGART